MKAVVVIVFLVFALDSLAVWFCMRGGGDDD